MAGEIHSSIDEEAEETDIACPKGSQEAAAENAAGESRADQNCIYPKQSKQL